MKYRQGKRIKLTTMAFKMTRNNKKLLKLPCNNSAFRIWNEFEKRKEGWKVLQLLVTMISYKNQRMKWVLTPINRKSKLRIIMKE